MPPRVITVTRGGRREILVSLAAVYSFNDLHDMKVAGWVMGGQHPATDHGDHDRGVYDFPFHFNISF